MRARRWEYGIACGLLVAACGTVWANDDFTRVEKAFEITVRDRANPLDPVLAVAGVLTLHVRQSDGRFTGWVTPGFRVSFGSPAGTIGTPLDSVLFRLIGGALVPDLAVKHLAVDGQFTGRGVNMVVRDVLGPGQHIFAQGTTERYTGNWFAKDPGRIAGPGVGPADGDRGDWAVRSETTCVRSVHVLPIAEDGSGGDVTEFTECISIRSTTLQPVP